MARSKTKIARSFELHPVTIALSKARAAAELVNICAFGDDYLQLSPRYSKRAQAEMRNWIRIFGEEALTSALDEADAAFRKTITPEEARRQSLSTDPDPANPPRLHVVETGGA